VMMKKAMFFVIFLGLAFAMKPLFAAEENFYSDGFSLPVLNSVWQWVDELGTAQYSLSKNPGNLSIYSDGQAVFARVVQFCSGPFTAEVEVSVKAKEDIQGAGLIIWEQEGNNMLLVRGMKDGKQVIDFTAVSGGEITEHFEVEYPESYVYLRLVRDGDSFTAWYSKNGNDWLRLGTIQVVFKPTVKTGVFMVNSQEDMKLQADFNYFRVHQVKSDAESEDEYEMGEGM